MSNELIKKTMLDGGFHEFKISPEKGETKVVMGFRVSPTESEKVFLVRYIGEQNGSDEHMAQLKKYCDYLVNAGFNAETKNIPGSVGDMVYSHFAIQVSAGDSKQ